LRFPAYAIEDIPKRFDYRNYSGVVIILMGLGLIIEISPPLLRWARLQERSLGVFGRA
jgi:hypothetical protein